MLPKIEKNFSLSTIGKKQEMSETEKKMAQKFIEKTKKIYCQKYNLDAQNVYERMFSSINSKILYEIELSKRKRVFSDDEKLFSVNNYQEIYNEVSNDLIKSLKNHQSFTGSTKFDELLFSKNINSRYILEIANKLHHKGKSINLIARVYDYDQSIKENIIDKRKKEIFNKEINLIIKNRNKNKKENPYKHLKFYSNEENNIAPEGYSKSAYLASLNYNFKNPIV